MKIIKNMFWSMWIAAASLFFGLSAHALGPDFCASGFSGTAGGVHTGTQYNGTWADSGSTFNSGPIYHNTTSGLTLLYNSGTHNRLDLGYDNGGGTNSAQDFYNPTSTGFDPTTGTWLNVPSGMIAGSFISGSCGGGGGGGATTTPDTATSTIEQYQNNLYHGFTLYFIVFFGIVAFFLIKFKR